MRIISPLSIGSGLLGLLGLFAPTAQAQASQLVFDEAALQATGLDDASLKHILSEQSVITGTHGVGVYVNDRYAGSRDVHFDDAGRACLDSDLLSRFDIDPRLLAIDAGTGCALLPDASPLKAGFNKKKNALFIDAPDYLFREKTRYRNLQAGGSGVFVNYDVTGSRSSFYGSASDSLTGVSTLGANIGGFLLRSDVSFARFRSDNGLAYGTQNVNNAYVETDIAGAWRLKTGYIGVGNAFFGAGQIWGFDTANRAGLRAGDTTVDVTGVASAFGQLEVWQQGRLVFSQPVAAGNYRIENVPLHTAHADAEIVLRQSDGTEKRFTVPRAAFRASRDMASSFSMFGGMLDRRQAGGHGFVLGAQYDFPFVHYFRPSVGALVAERYVGLGGGASFDLMSRRTTGALNASVSRSGHRGDWGAKLDASVSSVLPRNITAYGFARWQSRAYRDLGQSQVDIMSHRLYDITAYALKTSAGVGINAPITSRLTAGMSFSNNRYYDASTGNSLALNAVYSRPAFTVTGTVTHGQSSRRDAAGRRQRWNETAAFLTLSIPFGIRGKQGVVSSYLNAARDSTSVGTAVTQALADNWHVKVGAGDTRYASGRSQSLYAQSSVRTPYANTNLYYAQQSGAGVSRTWSANASGSVVLAKRSLVFSSAPVRDTFAIASTGMAGYTTLRTPTGEVTTNHDGLAVVPSLSPALGNVIQIDTRTLPDDAFVTNPRKEIWAARGAVAQVHFDVDKNRTYLMALHAPGATFPLGRAATDARGNVLGYTIDQDILMLEEAEMTQAAGKTVRILNAQGARCTVTLDAIETYQRLDISKAEAQCDS